MTWRQDDPYHPESNKIAHLAVPYTLGRCLDIGCGTQRVWPTVVGYDLGKQWGRDSDAAMFGTADKLPFQDGSIDNVFSSHTLEHMVDPEAALAEWWRVLRPGGHLSLYLPHADLYPNIGQPGANPDHKHDFRPEDIKALMQVVAAKSGAELTEDEVRDGNPMPDIGEYSFWQVWNKRADGAFSESLAFRRRPGDKRVLVTRHGAIGDQLIAGSVLPRLKEMGWHVTYNCQPKSREVHHRNPHIDAWWMQDKDQVPNEQLPVYYFSLMQERRWDWHIDLSESIENTLLTIPGRVNDFYAPHIRRALYGSVNYLERTHDIAGVPHRFEPKFYMTNVEADWSRAQHAGLGGKEGPVIGLCLVGSSVHKAWPYWDQLVVYLLRGTHARVVLLSDGGPGRQLQDAIVAKAKAEGCDLARLHGRAGVWDVRQALAFAHVCDVLVGPETGVMWAVSMHERIRKVVMLSHSSPVNFGKHWKGLRMIEPEGVGCYPCHRLHYDMTRCTPTDRAAPPEQQIAACAASIGADRVMGAVMEALEAKGWVKRKGAA